MKVVGNAYKRRACCLRRLDERIRTWNEYIICLSSWQRGIKAALQRHKKH